MEPRTDVVLVLAVAVATVVSTAAAIVDGKTFDLAHKRGRCACGRKPKDRNKKFCSTPRGVGNGEQPPERASDKLV